ncbi:MAG: MMPL family transporter [Actinobacteria bacterium]|nr:MMPL family transporter [Actinomycetota bacterium]
MTGPLYAIGRWCSRHHWPVIAAWVVLAIALVAISSAAGSKTSENLTLPGTGSTQATELLEENLPEQAYGSNPLVLEAPAGTKLSEPKYAKAVEETVKNLEALPDVNSAMSPLAKGSQTLSQKHPNIGYIPVVLGIGPGEIAEDQSQKILDTAKPFEAAGGNASIGSYVGNQLSKPSTEKSELIGLIAAVIILLFAFGTATAMMLPIVGALVGLVCTLSIIKLLEHVLEVPGVAATLATMIGLGVGIDYALFIVTRHKLQLKEGMDLRESIARATATAGGAVVFAGFTVVIALCSLAVAGIPLVTTLGITAAVAVVVAVCAAATLMRC